METVLSYAIPALIICLLLRALITPVKMLLQVTCRSLGGFACLWLINTVSGFTGLSLPLNALTVLIAGFLGIPGIGLIALLEMI